MRLVFGFLCTLALGACAQNIPDSNPSAGVGFKDYNQYIAEKRARDAQLARSARSQPQTIQQLPARTASTAPQSQVPAAPLPSQQTTAQQTAAQAVAAVRGTQAPQTSAPVQPQVVANVPAAAQPQAQADNPDISDEQDFGAVSTRQSIQSDAERRRVQSAQYKVIEPSALPRRPSNLALTPVEFAVSTSHPVGQKLYRRGLVNRAKSERRCQEYQSSELAQDAFLKAGGPQRDKLSLDPDGDGYACRWNPEKYRNLRGG